MSIANNPTPLLEAGTYNVPDLAELLKCSERHIRNMADAGDIPGVIRLGRLVRFHRGIVNEWLDAGAPSRSERETSRVASKS